MAEECNETMEVNYVTVEKVGDDEIQLEESGADDTEEYICFDVEKENLDNENFAVEYIDEDVEDSTQEEYLDNVDNLESHTLLMRLAKEDDKGGREKSYYCAQCSVDFASIEEFTQAHGRSVIPKDELYETETIEEQLWEVLPEQSGIIEQDQELKSHEQGIKTEQSDSDEQSEYESMEVIEDSVEIDAAQLGIIKQEESTDPDKEGNVFYCYECQSVFNDMESAEHHECSALHSENEAEVQPADQITNNQSETVCAYCHKNFFSLTTFASHKCPSKPTESDCDPTETEQFKCAHCSKVFATVKALNTHSRTHKLKADQTENEKDLPVCGVCNTTFGSIKNLKLHMKIHNKRPIKSIQEALPAGASIQYSELNQFYCEICNKRFDQNLLAVHKNMHQNVEEYNCSICNRQFENSPSYEMHMQLHADKPYERRGPISTNRPNSKLQFPCQYCGRSFPRPHEKVKHERVHTGEKPYECEVCGKTFRVSYSLTLHLRTHTDIRPYVCATCNKRFKSHPVYAHHLRTHLTERPYKCEICPKTFRTSVQLCGHKNSHIKPFNCPECNRPFATLYAVKIHMKTHSKSNKSNENLKHRCGICGAVYARVFALRLHMKDQHSLEVDANQALEMQHTSLEEGDAAVLIAAAAEADCATTQEENETRAAIQHLTDRCFNEDEISTQAILQNEEIIVENYHEEIVTDDWLK